MPVAVPPGPSTWLMGQLYGNTTGAYNFGSQWYEAGQGLHFGIDISMPCGTPLVAMADGEIAFVDNFGFGSRPHNLLIRHPQHNLIVLYGHLLERPTLVEGQFVAQGQQVALSGDPDSTCDSRPHLHLEVRSLDYRTAYNPIDYIDANWHALAAFGAFGYPLFQMDLTNPRRWMRLDDQPATAFGGARLNDYAVSYPPANAERPPASAPLFRSAGELPQDSSVTLTQITRDGCCAHPQWSATDPDRFYVMDGVPGERAQVYGWSASQVAPLENLGLAPLPARSPDGTHAIIRDGGQVYIRRAADNAAWTVPTGNNMPGLNSDNTRLLWLERSGVSVPGQSAPNASVWVSAFDGQNARVVFTAPGAGAAWLDEARLLLTIPGEGRRTTLAVYDTRTDTQFTLGTWAWLRGLSIAPGGGRLLFYITSQPDITTNGVFTIATVSGAQAERLPWIGGWQWRDADSLYYLPYTPEQPYQTLAYYHIPTRTNRTLTDATTLPFLIANGDWDVSADGRRILFQSANDGNLWVLEVHG